MNLVLSNLSKFEIHPSIFKINTNIAVDQVFYFKGITRKEPENNNTTE